MRRHAGPISLALYGESLPFYEELAYTFLIGLLRSPNCEGPRFGYRGPGTEEIEGIEIPGKESLVSRREVHSAINHFGDYNASGPK